MNSALPAVTVVIPVYNAASTLAETLESLRAQTFADFEAVIVDDGTPDHSMRIAAPYLDDPRFRVVTQENRGLNGARNTGVRTARGRYVAFLDADDLWRPSMLATHVARLDVDPALGISFSPSALITESGRALPMRQRPKLRDITPRDVICRNPLGNGSAGVFRREVFDGIAFRSPETPANEVWWFDERFRQSTDIECWMRIVAQTHWKFEGVRDILVDYRVNSAGLSANTERQLMFWERGLAAMGALRPDLLEKYGRRARAYQLRYLARRQVSARDGGAALTLMKRALREDAAILVEEPVKTLTTLGAALALSATGQRKLSERVS